MAAQSITTDNQHPDTKILDLQETVNSMDCMSQEGFSEISSMARLALAWLEKPDCYRHMEVIADALTAIRNRAQDASNCINVAAEDVGCNYANEDRHRRYDAQREVWNHKHITMSKPK